MTFQEWVQEKTVVDGLISLYKPYGIPSTALTDMYKCVTGMKVGHGGTLDPLATGAMLLGIGKGTKLLTQYLESQKRYRAGILIGAESASGDLELPISLAGDVFEASSAKIGEIIEELAKGFTQELPELNASKQQGKAAYKLIRAGKVAEKRFVETRLLEWKLRTEEVLTSKKLSTLLDEKAGLLRTSFEHFDRIGAEIGYHSRKYDFMLEKWLNSLKLSVELVEGAPKKKYVLLDLEVLVPKGTYIRSLAQDIASRLGTVGMLVSLERLSAGNESAKS
jgi:tRNA pseudouridine55 synthase